MAVQKKGKRTVITLIYFCEIIRRLRNGTRDPRVNESGEEKIFFYLCTARCLTFSQRLTPKIDVFQNRSIGIKQYNSV